MPIGCQLGIAATKVGVVYARETRLTPTPRKCECRTTLDLCTCQG